jgi:hypothetical protein
MSLYAVNGKVPVAAWIPSRDDASVGTSTLRDLVGSNNGTLTNMDPATDWVADTGAGGIRALDFDGVNDRVLSNAQIATAGDKTVSAWVNSRTNNAFRAVISGWVSNAQSFEMFVQSNGMVGGGFFIGSRMVVDFMLTLNTWQHWVVTQSGSDYTLYLNGLSVAVANNTGRTGSAATTVIGARGTSLFFSGLLDDIRFWNQALDASDVLHLWGNGNGRGRIATSRPRINGGLFNAHLMGARTCM